ncbi:MAG: hypothetical protein M3463_13950 [Verrucomicrobiota bacterium]|nr:hypothetical protein [Verrucomicrobiota bacterium]
MSRVVLRVAIGVSLVGVIVALGALRADYNKEKARVMSRWSEMERALGAGDQERVRALMPPDFKGEVPHVMSLVFVRPLTPKSRMWIIGRSAGVCPELQPRHYWIFSGGNTVSMTKVDDEWFFTGRVIID